MGLQFTAGIIALALTFLPLHNLPARQIKPNSQYQEKKVSFSVGKVNYINTDYSPVFPKTTPRYRYAFSVSSTRSSTFTHSSPYPISTPYDSIYKAAGAKFGVPWQILYGIHLTETGLGNGAIFNHQGSGAEGPMQFMPGTFNEYAVSATGGTPDINNASDAIYTAANFLQKHGSIMQGLIAYGGNISGTLRAAESRGYTP